MKTIYGFVAFRQVITSEGYTLLLDHVKLNGVGPTALHAGIARAVHVALTRGGRERSAVAQCVTTIAFLTVFNTSQLEASLSAGGGTLVDGHVGVIDSKTGEGSASYLLNATGTRKPVDDNDGRSNWSH